MDMLSIDMLVDDMVTHRMSSRCFNCNFDLNIAPQSEESAIVCELSCTRVCCMVIVLLGSLRSGKDIATSALC